MNLVVVTPPATYPVSLTEAKAQCAITDTTHDDLLTRLIKAATASVEEFTGAKLMPQTVRLEMDCFPDGAVDLGLYHVEAVTSVAYDDAAGDEQTLVSGTDYWPQLDGMYPRLLPINSWPGTKAGKPAAVRITMTAGFTSADLVPDDLKHAILMRVKEMFANRGESVQGTMSTASELAVEALAGPHRRVFL